MRTQRSSKFSQIGPTAALEHQKKIPICLEWEKRCCHFFFAAFDHILFILQGFPALRILSPRLPKVCLGPQK